MLSETSSVTRMPVAYISSSIAASRDASAESNFVVSARSASTSSVVIGFGTGLGARGESIWAVGLVVMSPWSRRKAQNDFTAATFRATVAFAYERWLRSAMKPITAARSMVFGVGAAPSPVTNLTKPAVRSLRYASVVFFEDPRSAER